MKPMDFSMQVANPEEIKKEVALQVASTPGEVSQLQEQAEKNAAALMDLNLDSLADKKSVVGSIESFGNEAMKQSAQKNSLMAVTVGKLSQAGGDSGTVSKSLLDLHREIKDLDPSMVDFAKTGILGSIFNPIRAYFQKYEKAENVIADIVVSLDKGRSVLVNDNTTLELEENSLRELSKRISKEIELGTLMDQYISAQLEKAQTEGADAEKIKFIQEEILFPLRQKVMDMQQMIVVNHQGVIAMEIIRRNNKELIRGVDRAKSVTNAALRTAVMVASALYNQRIVLKKIQALNETTNNIISTTSKMLKEQGAEIQTQSMQTGVSVETLKESYKDLIDSLEAISTYKQQALPVMKQTIETFRQMAEEGEVQIQRLERGSAIN
jgi:uncharacterized protein YaaN involved in tellurite resistance